MPVEIKIYHETASDTLDELRVLAGGLTGSAARYAPEGELPQAAQEAKVETKPVEQAKAPKRERGKPAPGRSRRTKEEIAVDEAAEKAEAAAEEQPNISANPEDRQDPENPEVAAQDEADEQAEVEANRDAEKPLTIDDLRAAMGEFVNAHGMPAAQKHGVQIFKDALGNPPAGRDGWTLSVAAEQGQEAIAKAIAAWKAAAADKSYGD